MIERGSCAVDVAGFTLSVIGLVLGSVSVTTGPIGFIAGANLAIESLSTGFSGSYILLNGNCF